mgnify:CR=1 FL=1
MIKNILFDLGGVLIDLDRDEAVHRFEALGVTDANTLLDAYVQRGIFKDLENGTLTASQFEDALAQQYEGDFSHEAVFNAVMGFFRSIPLYKFNFLNSIKDQYRLFILSNTNPYIMEYMEGSHFLPGGLTLSDCVEKIFASYRYGVMKPEKKFFEAITREVGILPEESLFIDDGKANTDAAKTMGFNVLWVENGTDWRSQVSKALALDRMNTHNK